MTNKLDLALQKPLVLTIHGWNSGGSYMRHHNQYIEGAGYPVFNYVYGWIIAKTFKNGGIVDRVEDFVNFYHDLTGQKVILFGHSNGCEIAWRVSRQTDNILGLVFNNAALDTNVRFDDNLKFVHNWYTPSDKAVSWSRWIPFNNWGNLGAKPYDGTSTMVTNFNKGDHRLHATLVSTKHSDTYNDPALRAYFLPKQIHFVTSALS